MTHEMFQKVPPGYRKATSEEQQGIMDCGMMLQLTNARAGQCRAELEAAQLRLKMALSEAALANNQQAELFRSLKVQGKPGDIHGTDSGVYILEDESKRLEVWPSLTAAPMADEKKAEAKKEPE